MMFTRQRLLKGLEVLGKGFLCSLALVAFTDTALAADKPPEQIMRANCASCHGQNGEGGHPSWIDPSEDSMRIAGRSVKSLKGWVRKGRIPVMPAFPAQEINDTELDALARYINGLPGTLKPEPTAQATVTITDEDPWYNLNQISINVGDTVKFINLGKTWHPVTQLEFVATEGLQGTDAGLLGPTLYGGGVYFRKFDTPGKYTFLCKIHPYMQGEIYVGQVIWPPVIKPPVAPLQPPTTPGTPLDEIWVTAQFQDYAGKAKDGVVQVIDPLTWTVKNMIPVGNNPHNLWFTEGGAQAVVTNWFDNYISIIDGSTKQPLTDVITGATNAHVISNFDGSLLYVTIQGSHYVQTVKPRRWNLGAQIWTSGYGPHGIWYGDGKLLTANTQDNTVTVYDAASEEELTTLRAGLLPLGAGLNTTGTKGYNGNGLGGTVSVYDTVNLTKIKDISVGGVVVQTPVTPDNKYVVAANSPYTTVIDATTDTVVTQFWTGKGAHGVAFRKKKGSELR